MSEYSELTAALRATLASVPDPAAFPARRFVNVDAATVRAAADAIEHLTAAQFDAFLAGFKASGEGFNGEYGLEADDDPATDPHLLRAFARWRAGGVTQ